MSTDTETQRFDGIGSIDWKSALRAVVEFVGRLGLILSGTVIYALFIVVVNEVMPLSELSRAGLEGIRVALNIPVVGLMAFAAARVTNVVGGGDINPDERRIALGAIAVYLLGASIYINLIDLGVV